METGSGRAQYQREATIWALFTGLGPNVSAFEETANYINAANLLTDIIVIRGPLTHEHL